MKLYFAGGTDCREPDLNLAMKLYAAGAEGAWEPESCAMAGVERANAGTT